MSSVYVQHLKRCISRKDLQAGKQWHTQLLIHDRMPSQIFLDNTLLHMYSKCGAIDDARRVFDRISLPNIFSWTSIITAYSEYRNFREVLNLFQEMQFTNISPDRVLFMLVINACTNIYSSASFEMNVESSCIGQVIHAYVTQSGLESDVCICKNLVEMYKNSEQIHDARGIFENSLNRDVVLWTAMISGYVRYGYSMEALDLFAQMFIEEGIKPNEMTLTSVVKACTQLRALDYAMYIHSMILENSLDTNACVANSLMDMYVKCGYLNYACTIFKKMHKPDNVSWTIIIAGHAMAELGKEGIDLFVEMQKGGMKANHGTYTSVLKSCVFADSQKWGMYIHAHIMSNDVLHMDVSLENTLFDMYTRCGCIVDARCMFDNIVEKSVVTWTSMITGCLENDETQEALRLFQNMQMEGLDSDVVIFVSVLKSLMDLDSGKRLHAQILASGICMENLLASALIDMYVNCQCIDSATKVFHNINGPDVVSWTAMIAGYSENGLHEEALSLFEDMDRKCMRGNHVTYAIVLKVCQDVMDVARGKEIHRHLVYLGYDGDIFIAVRLVDLYAKCGSIEDACCLFDSIPKPDLVSWNILLAGYVRAKKFVDAFALYGRMEVMGIKPDTITVVEILQACIGLAAFEDGKRIHGCIIEWSFEEDVFICSNLMAMYAKCGSVNDAHVVFSKLKNPDLVSWNVMLRGCAEQGHCKETLELFEQIWKDHSYVNPDIVTFGCVLAACSHGGLLEKGKHYFELMIRVYGHKPLPWHCACIVDLLCRAGHLSEAEEFIGKLPIQPDVVVWMSLLGGCRNHNNATLGSYAFNNVIQIDVKHVSAYVLITSVYAAVGKWEEAAAVRKAMETVGLEYQDDVQHSYLSTMFPSLLDNSI